MRGKNISRQYTVTDVSEAPFIQNAFKKVFNAISSFFVVVLIMNVIAFL